MEKKINKRFFVVIIIISTWGMNAFSQLKIGYATGTPNLGAMLDVDSWDRGVLFPRIYLTSKAMYLNGSAPTEGALIFSTNWSGDGSLGGLFMWKNNNWEKLNDRLKVPVSHVKVLQNTQEFLPAGNNLISWNQLSEVQQPQGDAAMWTASNPNTITIRRKGWYFVSASLRIDESRTGTERFIAITKNGGQVTGSGMITVGYINHSTNRPISQNTSTMIMCDVNDEIRLVSYTSNDTNTTTSLGTVIMTVTQLGTSLF